MDSVACNWSAQANTNVDCIYAQTYYNCDGTCEDDDDLDGVCNQLEQFGCTNPDATNYDSFATEDDGSCILIILGCTDENACNWNSQANFDNGSCIYAEVYYDCLGNCINDSDGNGLCDEEDPIGGCMSEVSLNYDEYANFDDGSCVFEFQVNLILFQVLQKLLQLIKYLQMIYLLG